MNNNIFIKRRRVTDALLNGATAAHDLDIILGMPQTNDYSMLTAIATRLKIYISEVNKELDAVSRELDEFHELKSLIDDRAHISNSDFRSKVKAILEEHSKTG